MRIGPILSRRSELCGMIRAQWSEIVERAKARGMKRAPLAVLPGEISILGGSMKTQKGESVGILTAVVYLSPGRESGADLCPDATKACRAACLGHSSGRMQFDAAKNARLWKSVLREGARGMYETLLRVEIDAHRRSAERLRMIPAVRLDGSSDTGDGERIARDFPSIQFYDYTKNARRFFDGSDVFGHLSEYQSRDSERQARHAHRFPPNYTLVYSHVPERETASREILKAGFSVAVVFRGAMPAEYMGAPVIDGDATDARFIDARGRAVVVGLSLKGPKPRKTGARGFAV